MIKCAGKQITIFFTGSVVLNYQWLTIAKLLKEPFKCRWKLLTKTIGCFLPSDKFLVQNTYFRCVFLKKNYSKQIIRYIIKFLAPRKLFNTLVKCAE